MIRLILAGANPVVRGAYRRLLERAGYIRVVAVAGDGHVANAACAEQLADVVVTDLGMPGGGLELIRRLRVPETRMLAFSMDDSPRVVAKALQAGALGCASKADAPPCLLDAVCALYAGRRYPSPELAALSPSADERVRALSRSPKTLSDHQMLITEELGVDSAQRPAAQAATDTAWTATTPC